MTAGAKLRDIVRTRGDTVPIRLVLRLEPGQTLETAGQTPRLIVNHKEKPAITDPDYFDVAGAFVAISPNIIIEVPVSTENALHPEGVHHFTLVFIGPDGRRATRSKGLYKIVQAISSPRS